MGEPGCFHYGVAEVQLFKIVFMIVFLTNSL